MPSLAMLFSLFFATLCSAQQSSQTASQPASQTFVSAPDLHPPVLSVNKSGPELGSGLLLITSDSTGPDNSGPAIMTDSGDLVWNGPANLTTNLVVQTLDGKPVLTYWIGNGNNLGHGYGQVNILDTTYTQIYTICPDIRLMTPTGFTEGCALDLHESFVTTRGTILCTAVNITNADLTSVGGPRDGWIYDDMFFEIDIKTNEILFMWSPLQAGIPINSTKQALGSTGSSQSNPFDWFVMNSVTALKDGYLANSRYMWSSYALDLKGELKWVIEGSTGGDFTLPPAANFSWQHHVRVGEETSDSLMLHMFNDMNAAGDDTTALGEYPSNGLLLHLDLKHRDVTRFDLYIDPKDEIAATSQGSFEVCSNGNVLLSYGNVDYIKEFGPDGDVRMSISGASSYRAYRLTWDATPAAYGPNTTAVGEKGWVSWNGDTRTTKWVVYAGASKGSLTRVGEVARTGFETQYSLPSGSAWVQVAAFAGDIHLRNSSVVPVSN